MNILPNLNRLTIPAGVSLLFAASMLTGCNLVNEDMPECAPQNHTYTIVNFEYKYHMSSEYVSTEDDWFGDHAGSAYLYVFDEDGTYLFNRQRNKAFLDQRNPDFSITMDETEIIPGNKYILAAMAQGNHAGYEASLATPGFQLLNEMVPGFSKIDDFRVKLDRNDDGYYDLGVVTDDYGFFNYKDDYENNNLKLDTLWSTRPGYLEYLDVPYKEYEPSPIELPSDTIPVTMQMMRITNSIKINLVFDGFTPETPVTDYKFMMGFPHGNGTLGFTGELDTELSQPLMYFSLRKEVKQYQYKDKGAQYDAEPVDQPEPEAGDGTDSDSFRPRTGTRAATYCISAEFGVSRLQEFDESYLTITNTNTGRIICDLHNISDWLADYFDHRYGNQEFLDREYDYTIDVKLDDDGNYYIMQAGCHILGWGKRIQREILGKK